MSVLLFAEAPAVFFLGVVCGGGLRGEGLGVVDGVALR